MRREPPTNTLIIGGSVSPRRTLGLEEAAVAREFDVVAQIAHFSGTNSTSVPPAKRSSKVKTGTAPASREDSRIK